MTGPPLMKRNAPRSRSTPGARNVRRWKSRSGTGSASICSGMMFVDESVLWMSTTGDAALTVIVSLVFATIVAESFAFWPTTRARLGCFTGANPSSAKSML